MKKIVCFLLPLLILFAGGCQEQMTCESLETTFSENSDLFIAAANAILDVPSERLSHIQKEEPQNAQIDAVQIGQLFFWGAEEALCEEYEKLYPLIEPLFSNHLINGIAYSPYQIQFAVQLYWGKEASIIFVYAGQEPSGSFPHKEEQKQISEGWYALIATD